LHHFLGFIIYFPFIRTGHAWKDFKWKLNINYVKKDKTPFEDYPELKKEWWPNFVEWVTSDDYIALGEKGKKSQSMNPSKTRSPKLYCTKEKMGKGRCTSIN
jgi:hypothetical protein